MTLEKGCVYKTIKSFELSVYLDGVAFLTSRDVEVGENLMFEYLMPQLSSHEFKPLGDGHPDYRGTTVVNSWGVLIDEDKLVYLEKVKC